TSRECSSRVAHGPRLAICSHVVYCHWVGGRGHLSSCFLHLHAFGWSGHRVGSFPGFCTTGLRSARTGRGSTTAQRVVDACRWTWHYRKRCIVSVENWRPNLRSHRNNARNYSRVSCRNDLCHIFVGCPPTYDARGQPSCFHRSGFRWRRLATCAGIAHYGCSLVRLECRLSSCQLHGPVANVLGLSSVWIRVVPCFC